MNALPPALRPARPRHSTARLAVAVLALSLLGGCAGRQWSDGLAAAFTPYRIDIVQGNVLTREQVALLKPGMTRTQVRDVLGTPLVTDLFHGSRWDYVFTIDRPGTAPQRRSVIVLFEGEGMKSIDAPELPSERDFVASISRRPDVKPRVLELTEDELKALPLPPKREAPAAEPMGPQRDYPPLEAS